MSTSLSATEKDGSKALRIFSDLQEKGLEPFSAELGVLRPAMAFGLR